MVKFDMQFKQGEAGTENIMQRFQEAVDRLLRETADQILQKAVKNLITTRGDGYITSNTGRLAQSGRVQKISEEEYEVFFEALYGAWVEFGTFPHAPPLGVSLPHRTLKAGKRKGQLVITALPDIQTNPLDWWAWRRGERIGVHAWDGKTYRGVHTKLGWFTWLKIKEFGSDPHPFLRPAIAQVEAALPKLAAQFGLELVGEFMSE